MWKPILNWLSNLGRAMLGFMGELMTSIAKNGGAALIEASRAAVIAAENQGGSGDDKLKAARAAVISSLTRQGIPIVLNAINGAIEAAVARMNAQKG